ASSHLLCTRRGLAPRQRARSDAKVDDANPGVCPPLPHNGSRSVRALKRFGVDRRHRENASGFDSASSVQLDYFTFIDRAIEMWDNYATMGPRLVQRADTAADLAVHTADAV